jgi:hypothetical protein
LRLNFEILIKNPGDDEKIEEFLRKRDDNYVFNLRTAGQQRYGIGLHCDGMRWRVEPAMTAGWWVKR